MEKWREIFRRAQRQFRKLGDMHTYDKIKTIGEKNMVFLVERVDGHWFVIDQFRFNRSNAYKTKKAAQDAIAAAGWTEAPVCKWGYLCDMGYSRHVH